MDFKHSKAAGYLFLALVILFLLFYGQQYAGGRRSVNALVIGTVSCVSLLFIGLESGFLSSIGFYSYTIYLFHVFFTAAARIFFKAAGITNIWLLFLLCTFAGLIGPVIVELFTRNNTFSRLLFLGKGPQKKRTNISSVIPPESVSARKAVMG
jgi:membrane-bound acyltransferase YfiQ involved in biofilm formation